MKAYKYFPLLLQMVLSVTSCINNPKNNFDKLNSSLSTIQYLGQKPPGDTPEIFAPGVVSTVFHEHSAPSFSPDGKTLIYTLSCEHGHIIMEMKLQNGTWSVPKSASFSGKYSDDGHVWSNDGSKLYFRSKRPIKTDSLTNEYNDWVVSRNDTGWAEPELNSFSAYSFSNEGINYCYLQNQETGWDIYESHETKGYRDYTKLDTNINSINTDATPCIDKDEKFIIFASTGRIDAIGVMDLYVSFKKKDGSWTEAKNFGEPINSPGQITRFPRISPDGKYLFYWSNIRNDNSIIDSLSSIEESLKMYNPYRPENGLDGDIYWVDAKIIDRMKPIDIEN